jgi:predicted flap endonuclease-1-like 5' DNA nuclease
MKQSENKRAPSLGGWLIAAAAGLVAAAAAYVVGDFSITQSGFIGAVVFLIVGLILGMYWGPQAAMPVAPAVTAKPAVASAAAVAPAAAMSGTVAKAAAPAMPAPAVAQTAAPASFVSAPVADAAPAPAKRARVAKPKAAPAAKPKAAPAAKPAAEPAAAKVAKAPRVAKPKAPEGPLRLSAPRKGKADDLKEIEGIGPALEKLCHSLGFYHFDQISGWSDADVAWVDANMKTFKGRIARDKWIAQAKLIQSEGLDAFRIRAKTNDY